MNKLLLALPVDGRPVVREQVIDLLASAGWTLRTPEVAQLGHFRQPADRQQLQDWLLAHADAADGFVLSLDMLVYGGLVPSRFIDDELAQLGQWLAVLDQLKARYPAKPIYAFAATMRMSNNNYNEEEKLYWADYGSLIWAWSYHSDRFAQLGQAADATLAESARNRIPADIQADYLATRARNFALTESVLDRVAKGVIDRLILPQDDTAEFGFNIAERRRLQAQVAERGLSARVRIYPGADEVIHTLCARLVSQLRGDAPLKVSLLPSDPTHIGQLKALYEDRPILDSLASQIEAAGAVEVAQPAEADVVIAVHTCGSQQGDWAMQKPLPAKAALDETWLTGLRAMQAAGKPLAVLDLAYANGGDPALISGLKRHLGLDRLAGYAGWNTASNTIGGLMSQLVLARHSLNGPANRRTTALRLLEDFLYQAVLRQTVRNSVDVNQPKPDELRALVEAVFRGHGQDWLAANGFTEQIEAIYLPWDRTFEIGIRLAPVEEVA